MKRFLRGCGRVEVNEFIADKNISIHMKSNGAALEISSLSKLRFFSIACLVDLSQIYFKTISK